LNRRIRNVCLTSYVCVEYLARTKNHYPLFTSRVEIVRKARTDP
jgi:hypothetical protein